MTGLLHLPPVAFDEGWIDAGRVIARTGRTIVPVLEALRLREDDPYSVYLAECINRCTKSVKGPPAGRAWRRTAPARKGWVERGNEGATENSYALAAHLFWRAVQWHSGSTGGSLWGPMGDSTCYGTHWMRADTAAQVLLVATGQQLVAHALWRKAIHGA